MKALILNGCKENDSTLESVHNNIEYLFREHGYETNSFTLRNMKIEHCLGYFSCWIKTPGVCIINDIAREIVKRAVLSDYWVFLTPVTFGGYSSELKKAIDRMPPVLLPYFMKVKGEVHHRPRYEKHPHLVVFGSIECHDSKIEDIFNTLVQRNSINFHTKSVVSKIISRTDNSNVIKDKVREVFSKTIIKA